MESQAFVPSLQVKKLFHVKCVRELPVAGDVLVELNQQVKPEDVVARAVLQGELYIFRIAEKLGIEPFEVKKGLKVKEGESIQVGQLLCEHLGLFGLFKSSFYAPESGVVDFFSDKTGHLGVRAEPRNLDVVAHIAGTVTKIEANKGVVIESDTAYIQGIFGIGGEKRGTLKKLNVSLDHSLTSEDIPSDCKDCVLVGGTKPDLDAIQTAINYGAKGLVVGSIDDETLKGYLGYDLGIALTGDEQIPMTVIVTEGFGYIPLSERVDQICSELAGNFVSINGATQVRAGAMRPEMIIACNNSLSNSDTQQENKGLQIGSRVRLIRVPYFGLLAEVVELPTQMEEIPSGAKARILRVKLKNGKIVTVPRSNVELV